MSTRAFQIRCLVLCLVLVTGLSALSVRLIQIQVWEGFKWERTASAQNHCTEILPGLRGAIVDRNEELLAKTISLSTVKVNRYWIEDPTLVASALAYERASAEPGWETLSVDKRKRKLQAYRNAILGEELPEVIVSKHLARAVGILARPLGLRREELRRRIEEPISQGRAEFAIAKDLPEEVVDSLRGLIEENHLKGFLFENRNKRWYTSPKLATHVVGYTSEQKLAGPDGKPVFRQVGQFGVEGAMEEFLRGRDGMWDHLSLPMPGEEGSVVPPVHGLNVRLTVDMGIQSIIEEELDAALEEYAAVEKRGCIIVLDPKTGELLAMANRPHFDLNLKEGLQEGAMNYALQGIYEPGSTFKIIAASGALDQRLVSPGTEIHCEYGYFRDGSVGVPDHHPYGMLSIEGILVKSSNIGAYKVGRQLGAERFFNYVRGYGFGEPTGILLSAESGGRVVNTGNPTDFSRATYGYAVNVTPLQVAFAYGAIANGGELMRPRVVHSIVARDGTVLERFQPEVRGRVLRETTARQMREALTKVTEKGGTATRAAVPGFKVGGKTGTAIRIKNGRYQMRPWWPETHYTVSFCGMMPAEDPAFVCLVVIDDPRGPVDHIGGGTVAAPTFAKVAARLATHLNLTPTEPIESTQLADQR